MPEVEADETAGAEEEYWLKEPGVDRLRLFKSVTIKDGHVHGEDWAEKAGFGACRSARHSLRQDRGGRT